MINDGNHIFGYHIATSERTILLNWLETGFANVQDSHVTLLDDGRIAVLFSGWRDGEWNTSLYILEPTHRDDLPERIILTLGGMWLSGKIIEAVADFNRESQTHQIQVHDYATYGMGDDWQAGFLRLRMELMTGGGPDIIYRAEGLLADRGLLLDLYPFMDADIDLARTDFLPNVLAALEGENSSLPMIAKSFSIHTMIGKTEAVGHIQSWSFSDFLRLVEDSEHIDYLLGDGIRGNREWFLRESLMYAGPELINWYTLESNLDSEAFVHLLEISSRLPATQEHTTSGEYVSEYARMLRGEQLISVVFLPNADSYQELVVALGEVSALGMPTEEGGSHVIQLNGYMGINAATNHAEDAWVFLRQFLLPTADSGWGFPIRIDQYDAKIFEAKTPLLDTDEEGNKIELPRGDAWFGDGLHIELFSMTDEVANSLWKIVETARPMGRFDQGLWDIVQEEIPPFFAEDRTAEETARIIQNRVQTFLSERR